MSSAGSRSPADELRSREPVFHRREHGTTRAELETLIAPGFREVGASGRVYDREFVLDLVAERYRDREYEPLAGLEVDDFGAQGLSADAWLVTYRLRQGERVTRRASIWRRVGGRWVIAYHQGTVVAAGRPKDRTELEILGALREELDRQR